MKFQVYKDKKGGWRWNAQVSGNVVFASADGYEKPQKLVQAVRKHVVRGDEKLEAALVKALKEVKLNEKGGQLKEQPETNHSP